MNVNVTEAPQALRPRWLVFLDQWLRNPRRMASITPSGRQLARLMAAATPRSARYVVELGAGTGVITDALLARGIEPAALLAVEMNPVLYELLQHRFPDTNIACANARDLQTVVRSTWDLASGRVDAICSSLGLLTMSRRLQHEILAAAFQVLQPQGVFIQYTYGLRRPLDAVVCRGLNLQCRYIGPAWRNLPPARVYAYSRRVED